MRKRFTFIWIVGLALCFVIGSVACCGNATESIKQGSESNSIEEYSREIFAMDTYMTVIAYGENGEKAVELAEKEINRLDKLLSTGDSESLVYQINENGGGQLQEDLEYLLSRALEINESTEGAFNIAIYPVMEAWGFTNQEYKIPDREELAILLQNMDLSKIEIEDQQIFFENQAMKVDFGGIAKGYTSARIMDIFRECDVESGMVCLGGNVQLYGSKTDGSPWRVGIQSPDDASEYIGVLQASDVAIITSGGYERYFEEDGQTYHHIIDPSTGFPAESGIKSSTIVCPDGTMADALSTSLYIMGEEKAKEYWKKHSDEFEAILLTEDGRLLVTEGLEDSFDGYLDIEIIRK